MKIRKTVFQERLDARTNELNALYSKLYPDNVQSFGAFVEMLERCWDGRGESLRERDAGREANPDWYRRRDLLGMTLYAEAFAGNLEGVRGKLAYIRECGVNFLHLLSPLESAQGGDAPAVRLELGTMDDLESLAGACREAGVSLCLDFAAGETSCAAAENLLLLANRGVDAFCLDVRSHKLVRLMRLCCEIVCPGVLLLGRAEAAASCFGTPEKPEFHMLYHASPMTVAWHTIATSDVSLLKREIDAVCALPKEQTFLNYLRCRNEIAWELDYPWLREQLSMDETAHKRYLNNYFTGKWPGSNSRGELFRNGARLEDASLCATTASLCGVEAAVYERDPFKLEQALSRDLTLHAWLLSQRGIPVLCSGDEVGQLNDYTYKDDPARQADIRNLHRGPFRWDLAEHRTDRATHQGKLFTGLRRLEMLRSNEPCFGSEADVWTEDSGSEHVLTLVRRLGERELLCLFNFSGMFVTVGVDREGSYTELMYGGHYDNLRMVQLWPDGFAWLLRDDSQRGEASSV